MPDWTFLIIAGSFLIFLGFLMVAFGMTRHEKDGEEEENEEVGKKQRVKGGGVILIGPLPIVFGTDKKYALLIMILAIVVMLLSIIFLK